MSELADLITPLHKATIERKISWNLERENMIWTSQGPALIEINEMVSSQSYLVAIRNKDGVSLESRIFMMTTPMFNEVSDIFVNVKRSALQVDKIIDELKNKIMSL